MSREISLDFYRRRAKDLLRQALAGNPSARARFESHHPQFQRAAARKSPLTHFALNQAQFVIARESGYPGWPKLRGYIEAFQRARERTPQERIQSILRARDLDELRAFIVEHPDAPRFRIEPLGETPLHLAVGWVDGTRLLLESGADINAVTQKMGMTALRSAIRFGDDSDLEFVKLLLSRGADPGVASAPDKSTMQLAAYAHAPGIVRVLAEHGVPVDIFGAIALEDERAVRELAAAYPAVLAQRMRPHEAITITPLHLAAFHNLPRMVDVLLALGADVGNADEQGRTPIDLALHGGKKHAYERLRSHGAAPNPQLLSLVGSIERAEGIARLHSSIWNGTLASVIEALDADPTLVDQHFPDVWGTGGTYGGTALHWAAMAGQLEVAKLLVARGANPQTRDFTHNAAPLGWARQYRRRELIAFLESQ